MAKKAHVEIQRSQDNSLKEVAFHVFSSDNSDLTGNQIVEAISEALLLYWPYCPLEEKDINNYDA